jgi:hypothetical protein
MLFAASWKPLKKSNRSAVITVMTSNTEPVLMAFGFLWLGG